MPHWLLFLIVSLVTTQVATLVTTTYLHRGLTHKAVKFSKPVEILLRIVLWITTTIDRRAWAAVHRKHHAHSDEPGDPHSPKIFGFWKVQLGNLHYYRKECRNRETLEMYAKDIPIDTLDRVASHGWLALLILLVPFVLALGPLWGTAALFTHYATYIFLNSTINGAGHWFGYKNFDNLAGNLWITAILTAGEGLHNNHHALPTSHTLRYRWFEIDLGGCAIWTLRALRLASVPVLRAWPASLRASPTP